MACELRMGRKQVFVWKILIVKMDTRKLTIAQTREIKVYNKYIFFQFEKS